MTWYYESVDNPGYRQSISADDSEEWVVVSVDGLDADKQPRAYQVLFNKNNGEIRYQYRDVPSDDAAHARIGMREYNDVDEFSDIAITVSENKVNGALPGTGYKFVPAPPQPSKSYLVSVDAAMSGVAFLLTGYSGSFAPLAITDPNGNAISCDDTENVRCINIGLVQYVQVNVNGRSGDWQATVSAPFGGEGTFSFSAIRAAALGKHTLSLDEQTFQLDFGAAVDGNLLDGWLQEANGTPLGNTFTFYDDGAHQDGDAGDGLFGSDGFTPPSRGVAYLWAQGTIGDENIIRSDPAPFNFQPLNVQPYIDYVQAAVGSSVHVNYAVTNQDGVRHCYKWEAEVPLGFVYEGDSGEFCVDADSTQYAYVTLSNSPEIAPNGAAADIDANFYEVEEGRIVGGATVKVAFFLPVAAVEITNLWQGSSLRPNGTDAVSLTAVLLDDQGQVTGWSDNFDYTVDATLGSVEAPDGYFENGQMPLVFTSGDETGTAEISFGLIEGPSATTSLLISNPLAAQIELVATPTDLRDTTTATLVATLRDAWGDPVADQSVRLSVSDDDGREVNGTIDGSRESMGVTDGNGQVSATFTKGEGEDATLLATVHAEALVPDGEDFRVTHEDSETLVFSGDLPDQPGESSLFIPLIRGE